MNLREDVKQRMTPWGTIDEIIDAICSYIEKNYVRMTGTGQPIERAYNKGYADGYCDRGKQEILSAKEVKDWLTRLTPYQQPDYNKIYGGLAQTTDPKRIEKLHLPRITDGYWKSKDPKTESLYQDLMRIEAKINEIIDKPCKCGKEI